MQRQLSNQAAAARDIRKELKQAFPGTKFRVTSSSFSMGDTVDVRWSNGPTTEQVDAISDKYQYGSFDGMQDMYEYTNKRSDIPQTKYVMTQRELTDDVFPTCFEYIKKHFVGCDKFEFLNESSKDLLDKWRAWTPRELIARYLCKFDLSNGVDAEAIFRC